MAAAWLPIYLALLVPAATAQFGPPNHSFGPPTTLTTTPTTASTAAAATTTTSTPTTSTSSPTTTPQTNTSLQNAQTTSTSSHSTETNTSNTSAATGTTTPSYANGNGSPTSAGATSSPSLVGPSQDGSHSSGSGSGLSGAEKIGIGVGVGVGVGVLAALALLLFALARRRRRRDINHDASHRSSAANLYHEKAAEGAAVGGAALGRSPSDASSRPSEPRTPSRHSLEAAAEPADATEAPQHQQLLPRSTTPPPAVAAPVAAPLLSVKPSSPAREKFLSSGSGLKDDWVPTPLNERSGNVSPVSYFPVDSRPPSPLHDDER